MVVKNSLKEHERQNELLLNMVYMCVCVFTYICSINCVRLGKLPVTRTSFVLKLYIRKIGVISMYITGLLQELSRI